MLKVKYPNTQIFFDDSFENLSSYLQILDKENVFYFIDKKVFEIYNDVFNSLKNIIIIDSNEKSKSIEYSTSLINKLINLEANKKSYFIAIGGGVVCDITGFIASIYMRGVRFAYVPTTVLSITDASLGGKNGVNFNLTYSSKWFSEDDPLRPNKDPDQSKPKLLHLSQEDHDLKLADGMFMQTDGLYKYPLNPFKDVEEEDDGNW